MNEIKAISYEQARTDFLKNELQKAENRIEFWRAKIKNAKNAIQEMEAHDNASNAGWEANYYKDALEALDAMPKWISVDEGLPELDAQNGAYDVTEEVLAIDKYEECYIGRFYIYKYQGDVVFISEDRTDVTHWMPLPSAPEVSE